MDQLPDRPQQAAAQAIAVQPVPMRWLLALAIILAGSLAAAQLSAEDGYYGEDFFQPPEENTEPPMLGVQMTPPPRRIQEREGLGPNEGVYVFRVYDGTAAQQMGIQPGDVITQINGQPISSMQDLRDAVFASQVGEPVAVEVSRDGQRDEMPGAVLREWPEHIEMSSIDNSAEQRYRDSQMGRFERMMNELEMSEQEIADLERQLEETADQAPLMQQAQRRADQVRMELGRDPMFPMQLLAMPSWRFGYAVTAISADEVPVRHVEPHAWAGEAPAFDVSYSVAVVGGAL